MLQVANLQRTRFTKRLDAPPSLITRGMPLAEGKVEGRFEHAKMRLALALRDRTALASSRNPLVCADGQLNGLRQRDLHVK